MTEYARILFKLKDFPAECHVVQCSHTGLSEITWTLKLNDSLTLKCLGC